MELQTIISSIYTFRVIGNMRIKLLCEYDLTKKYKLCDYISFNRGEMFIKLKNIHNYHITYDKCYLALSYNTNDKYPNIECVYKDDYVPMYMSQPDNFVSADVLNWFNIKDNTLLYRELTNIAPSIIDENYDSVYEPYNYDVINKKDIIYPSIIFRDNLIKKINTNKISSHYDDISEYDATDEYDDTDDNDYISDCEYE